MFKVDGLMLHDEHRKARQEHRQWREDIDRWHDEHHRAATMLAAVEAAWDEAEAALEEHAQRIQALAEHSDQHEQMLFQEGWAVDISEDESLISDHQRFEIAHAEARKVHEKLQQLYIAVAAEVHELLKLTHPDAVVLETN